ncbi:hypothetical protein CAPTEDRAFT_55049, partial [Capitella teleta]
VDLLIENGSHVNARCPTEMSPLVFAIESDSTCIVKRLLDKGANPNTITNLGNAIELAIVSPKCQNKEEMIDLLIDYGADVNFADHSGITHLHNACCFNNVRVVKLLLNKGVEIDARNIYGITPLNTATTFPSNETTLKMILLLKLCGDASVNEKDNFGSTPLHYAAFSNKTETTQLLLEMGCKKDKKDHKGRTAADLAQMMGYGDIVQLL